MSAAADSGTLAIRDAVRDAVQSRTPRRIVGAGTWLDAGRPVVARDVLPMGDCRGIVDFTPDDLTLTARAGTSLEEIEEAVAHRGLWLPLEPPGSPGGTIGATIATASAGPLAHAFGAPRDHVLGLEMVTGTGEVVRSGGRVVKNVAGFDLVRLATGAWGTLGAITEVTVRLRARPAVDATVVAELPDDADAMAKLLEQVRTLPIAPLSLEAVSGDLAGLLGLAPGNALLVRFGGNAPAVDAQRSLLAATLPITNAPADVWTRLRRAEPADAWVFRLSDLPSRLGSTWQAALACTAAVRRPAIHASVGRGIVRCIVPVGDPDALARGTRALHPRIGRVYERLPASLWPVLADAPRDRLSRGVRQAFDPLHLLNPGILGIPAS